MKNVETNVGNVGFQKVVFENVGDVLAGGVQIQAASLTRFATDKIVPAGTLIGVKETDGTHKAVVITDANGPTQSGETFDVVPLGFTHFDVPVEDMTLAAVVLSGVIRIDALPTAEKDAWKSISAKLPRFTFV